MYLAVPSSTCSCGNCRHKWCGKFVKYCRYFSWPLSALVSYRQDTCGARRRSETYELVFFKKTLLFGMKREKTMFCEINWWNWVGIVLTPIRSQNLVELGKNILFRLPDSFRASRCIQRPLPGCDGRPGRENESRVSWLSNEPKIERWEWIRSYRAAKLHVRL